MSSGVFLLRKHCIDFLTPATPHSADHSRRWLCLAPSTRSHPVETIFPYFCMSHSRRIALSLSHVDPSSPSTSACPWFRSAVRFRLQGCCEYSSTRYFLLPVAISTSGCRFFAVDWRVVRIYGNSGLRDFSCNCDQSWRTGCERTHTDPPPVLFVIGSFY